MTWACLREDGKEPSEKDKFARVAINSEKTQEHDLISDVGIKSIDEHLAGDEVMRHWTSGAVTNGMELKHSPTNEQSGGVC